MLGVDRAGNAVRGAGPLCRTVALAFPASALVRRGRLVGEQIGLAGGRA